MNIKNELLSNVRKKAVNPSHKENSDLVGYGYAVVFNTESCYYYFFNESFRRYMNACRSLFLDGAALKFLMLFKGINVPRYHGPDLVDDIFLSDDVGLCYIGKASMIAKLEKLKKPEHSVPLPLFAINEIDRVIATVALDAKLKNFKGTILVSLGLPKQELFCLALQQSGVANSARAVIPVGAACDFLTGEKKRSGVFWRKIGFEWLPRLVREPRMFIRIIRSFRGLSKLL